MDIRKEKNMRGGEHAAARPSLDPHPGRGRGRLAIDIAPRRQREPLRVRLPRRVAQRAPPGIAGPAPTPLLRTPGRYPKSKDRE